MTHPNPPAPAAPAAPAPATPPPALAPEPPAAKTFTQDEVNAMMAREKDQGRTAEAQRVSAELGVDVEEAKRLIAAAKATEDAQKTEAQRAREAADAEKTAAATERQEAARERHALRIERQLVVAGVTDEAKIARIARLVDAEVGADEAAVKTSVEALKKEMPELFGTQAPPPPAPNSDPKTSPPKPQLSEDAYTRGMERAKLAGNRGQAYPTPAS